MQSVLQQVATGHIIHTLEGQNVHNGLKLLEATLHLVSCVCALGNKGGVGVTNSPVTISEQVLTAHLYTHLRCNILGIISVVR